MEYISIRSREDLRAEILRLEGVSREQARVIGAHFNSPGAVFSTIFSLFSNRSKYQNEKDDGIMSQDFVGLISRFVLPLVLNRTIFRNSNFLIKAVVGLVSQKASHFISEESLGELWHKVTALFDKEQGGILERVKSIFKGDKKKEKSVDRSSHPIEQTDSLRPAM